jgi:hypothetical protein
VRLIQVIPTEGYRLYGAIVKKEVELYKKNRGTFYRSGSKTKNSTKWAHKSYKGWIWIGRGMGEVVVAELQTKSTGSDEWQLFHAFMGFLDRHFAKNIGAINIQFY